MPRQSIQSKHDREVARFKEVMDDYVAYQFDFTSAIVVETILNPKDDNNGSHYRIPINETYRPIYENYLAQREKFWVEGDVIITPVQIEEWLSFKKPIKDTINFVFKWFSVIDSYININVEENMMSLIKCNEMKSAYTQQMCMEEIHSHLYGKFVEQFLVKSERLEIADSFDSIKSIQNLVNWCRTSMNESKTFTHTLVSFLAFESVNFFGKFVIPCWLKEYYANKFDSIILGNDLVKKDEMLHLDLAIRVYGFLNNRLVEQVIHSIFGQAVKNEIDYINECMLIDEKGLNKILLIQYVKFVADTIVDKLGYKKMYGCNNPFIFMENNLMYVKVNQFERVVTNYNSGIGTRGGEFHRLAEFFEDHTLAE